MDRLIVLAHRNLHGAPVAVDRPGIAQRLGWSLGSGAGEVFGERGRRGQRERPAGIKGDRHLGAIVDRHRIPVGVPQSEGATKRAVKWVGQDRDAAPGELVMQRLRDAVSAEFGVPVDEEGLAGHECDIEDPYGNKAPNSNPSILRRWRWRSAARRVGERPRSGRAARLARTWRWEPARLRELFTWGPRPSSRDAPLVATCDEAHLRLATSQQRAELPAKTTRTITAIRIRRDDYAVTQTMSSR